MSYDLSLCDPVTRECLELEDKHHMTGGTYCAGGTTRMWLNVTYNYTNILWRVLPDRDGYKGLRAFDGLTGADTIPILQKAISQLSDDINPDYWTSTEGNVKKALCSLLALSKMRPDGVWEVE